MREKLSPVSVSSAGLTRRRKAWAFGSPPPITETALSAAFSGTFPDPSLHFAGGQKLTVRTCRAVGSLVRCAGTEAEPFPTSAVRYGLGRYRSHGDHVRPCIVSVTEPHPGLTSLPGRGVLTE